MSLLLFVALSCTAKDDTAATDTGSVDTGTPDALRLIDPATLPQATNPCREPVLALVTNAVDGDTAYMLLDTDGSEEKVRFIGIDTPETGYGGEPSDCYGDEAKARAEALLEGELVWLTFDRECDDQYDRTLAYLHRGDQDGDFVNRRLVREGFGYAFPYNPNTSFEDEIQSDEDAARAEDAGLWGSCH